MTAAGPTVTWLPMTMVPVRELTMTLPALSPRLDHDLLEEADEGDPLGDTFGGAHRDRDRVDRLGLGAAERGVDAVDEAPRRGEVRVVQVEDDVFTVGERRRHRPLHARAEWDAPHARHVDRERGAVVALDTEAADDQVALCDRVDLAVRAAQG